MRLTSSSVYVQAGCPTRPRNTSKAGSSCTINAASHAGSSRLAMACSSSDGVGEKKAKRWDSLDEVEVPVMSKRLKSDDDLRAATKRFGLLDRVAW